MAFRVTFWQGVKKKREKVEYQIYISLKFSHAFFQYIKGPTFFSFSLIFS